ncbi:MAG: HNH endonuclease [Promethearchaeota archaeon]
MEKVNKLEEISSKISSFFHKKHFTSSYKPIIFESILIILRKNMGKEIYGIYYILINDVAKTFLKLNYILFRRFKLRQLNSARQNVKIYGIIEEFFSDICSKKLKDEDINEKGLSEVKKLLFRHVLFLLRKDMHIFDFYDENQELIDLKVKIKDEQEFKKLLNSTHIKYMGLTAETYSYIQHHFPILEKATLGVCTEFLEGLNTVPKLYRKLSFAAGTFHLKRNISDKYKRALFEYQKNECFYCKGDMGKTPHADHFIPYDYLFDSPMWNIVGACKKCNLRKSNYLVNSDYLEQLLQRNMDPAFQKKFEEIILNNFIDVDSMNRELRQHYDQCSIYFDFLKHF